MPKSYLANKITTAKKITHRDLHGRCRTKKKRELNLWQNIWDRNHRFFFKDRSKPCIHHEASIDTVKKVRLKEKLHHMLCTIHIGPANARYCSRGLKTNNHRFESKSLVLQKQTSLEGNKDKKLKEACT